MINRKLRIISYFKVVNLPRTGNALSTVTPVLKYYLHYLTILVTNG